MKILLDESLPKRLKRFFGPEHEVKTVPEAGWASKKNGELLRLMSGQFEVFVTVDRNMRYQNPLDKLSVGFIVLIARSNRREHLEPLMPQVLEALKTIAGGQIVEVRDPSP